MAERKIIRTYQTTRGISAAMASSIPAAASGGLDFVSTSCSDLKGFISDVRNEDGRGGSSGLLHGIAHCSENWSVQVCSSSFLGIRSTDDLGTLYV